MATADPPARWRRYVILHHRLPPHQSLPLPTSPREPPSPAGGDGACDANPPRSPEPSRNPEPSRKLARGSHYDLMFETTAGLLTWAVEHMPVAGQPPQPALRLPLHRAAYLDYQGPVSGDRGEVLRVQAGTYRPASRRECVAAGQSAADEFAADEFATDEHFAFRCEGRDADGRSVAQLVLLERAEAGGWALRSIIAPPR